MTLAPCHTCGGRTYVLHGTATCVSCNTAPAVCTCRPVAVTPRWLQISRQRSQGLARDESARLVA